MAAIAIARGVSPAAAFIELALETDGHVVGSMPFLNQDLAAVEAMLDDPLVTLGLADAGAHVGQIMDASQPTFFLTYWIRERQRWSIEEADPPADVRHRRPVRDPPPRPARRRATSPT